MRKARKFLGVIGVSLLLAASLSGCGFRPLPHEERYQNIDNVLETIDYTTVGDIVKEEIDDGDGVFSTSYKIIYYGNEGSFEELTKRLTSSTETCTGGKRIGQLNCSFPHVSVSVFYSKETNPGSNFESIVSITDSSSGRNN